MPHLHLPVSQQADLFLFIAWCSSLRYCISVMAECRASLSPCTTRQAASLQHLLSTDFLSLPISQVLFHFVWGFILDDTILGLRLVSWSGRTHTVCLLRHKFPEKSDSNLCDSCWDISVGTLVVTTMYCDHIDVELPLIVNSIHYITCHFITLLLVFTVWLTPTKKITLTILH